MLWEAVRKEPISHWLMLWSSSEIREARKEIVWCNLVGARSLEGLGTLGRLGLEGLLLFMYPKLHFLVDYLPLGRRWRDFMPKASVSSSITHHVLSLCLHLSFLNLCHLISAVDVILFGLDCLSILY